MAVVVDPINEFALKSYKKYDFVQLPDSDKMFIPMNTIKKIIKKTALQLLILT